MRNRKEINRREFLRLRRSRAPRTLELSGEQLLMRFLDASREGTTAALFARLEADLQEVDEVRLVDVSWLRRDDLSQPIARILDAFRARGGRVRT